MGGERIDPVGLATALSVVQLFQGTELSEWRAGRRTHDRKGLASESSLPAESRRATARG